MKKDGKNKSFFRSQAKRNAHEYLQMQIQTAQRKLRDNKRAILFLTKEQNELKKDVAGLNQLLMEFLK